MVRRFTRSTRFHIFLLFLLTTACTLSRDVSPTSPPATPTLDATPIAQATQPPSPTPTSPPTATSRPPSPVATTTCTPRTDWVTYTVVRGDTLFSLARRTGSTVAELTAGNCLTDPSQLETGQTLRLPRLPAAATPPPATGQVYMYLVALEDDGASGEAIGCGDSIVPVRQNAPATQDIPDLTRAALEALFAADQFFGQSGLYNALAPSTLTVQNVTFNSGTLTVNLSGTLYLVGVCEDARIEAQLVHTVFQFPTVNLAYIYVDGTHLRTFFDMSGEGDNDAPYRRP